MEPIRRGRRLMCGITGKIDLRGPIDRALLETMCGLLEHRGPDSRGIHADGGVGLGVQRLAVIDLVRGDQPIYNEDGSIVVVLNGEIYNYVELRERLLARGHRFATDTDTETIVHLYEDHGASCVHQLRGMFAFAVWDARRRILLLARDRIGKKPLFFRATEHALWFASEPRAILADSEVPRKPDLTAIDSYLRFQYVPAPLSAFEGVRKLPPAHLLRWSGGQPEITRYWQLEFGGADQCSEADAAELVRESLLEATRLRLRSDVAVGAFLSGGLDSSAVVAAMARTGSGQVKTFSIGFDAEGYDETRFAREVAHRYGTEHREFTVQAEAVTILPRLVWHYGEPFADSSALPSFYLAELTRQHVTVALNGDGGDECFAGYDRYLAEHYLRRLDLAPAWLRERIARSALRVADGASARSLRHRLARALKVLGEAPWERHDSLMSYFTRSELDALYEPAFASALPLPRPADSLIRDRWTTSGTPDLVNAMLAADTHTYLPGDLLVKMDIASMAHSLEVRSPFLDHVLMERVASLPGSLKLRHTTSKVVLKEAMRGWLPGSILHRKKMGFGVPIASWFRGPLGRVLDESLLDPAAVDRGIFRPRAIALVIDDHRQGRADNSSRLWALLLLELWFQTYIDRGAAAHARPVSDGTIEETLREIAAR